MNNPEQQPTYQDLAGVMELILVRPDASEEAIAAGIEQARAHELAAVVVRPTDLDSARNWVRSGLTLGTILDVPHGYSTTSVKQYAVRDLLRRGAKSVDTVLNTGKLRSRQFQYLEAELLQLSAECRSNGALLKVAIESQFLDEELKILSCRICRRAEVPVIASSSAADLPLLLEYSKERLQIQMTAETLDQAIDLRTAGCHRLQSENAIPILKEWRLRLEQESQTPVVS